VRAAAWLLLLLGLGMGAAPGAAAPHPADAPRSDTEVFSGAEEPAPPPTQRPPAVAYWRVRAEIAVGAVADPSRVAMLVPLSDGRQDVLLRGTTAPGFRVSERQEPPNLQVEWTAERLKAPTTIAYDVAVRISEARDTVPDTPIEDVPVPPEAQAWLAPTPDAPADAPLVRERAAAVVGRAAQLDEIVWSLFQYVAAFPPPGEVGAPQDALPALEHRVGTSLGRARALVALLRASGVAARVVGGLRLENASRKRGTTSWVEAWTGTRWVPLDPVGGHYAALPNSYLALYRGDRPLLVHTRGMDFSYGFTVRQTTRRAVEESVAGTAVDTADAPTAQAAGSDGVQTHAAYVPTPVASVVLIADQSIPAAAIDRILAEARDASIDLVLLTARFESRYFRERYLERLVSTNLPIIRDANLVLVATADSAGVYALLTLAERGVRLPDSRIIVSGQMSEPSALMLGSLLYNLVRPGEVALIRRPADILPLWEMARANLIDGAPLREEAGRWSIDALVLGEAGTRLPSWRRPLLHAWAQIVRAGVPLPALTLILVLPIIASVVVFARLVVGVPTFGTFGPVIVSLAFVTTGLWWGTLTFVVIVGLGILLRTALQRLRLQAVARVAILITLVSVVMGGLTLLGARLGIGPLLHLSVFPMLIMANVVESFAGAQVELGTRTAVRQTLWTLLVSIACYLLVDRAGLQALVVAFPEILVLPVLVNVALGKWRGMRLLEYLRFRALATPISPPGAHDRERAA
jgi:transglutaminase-like putative cysteine protease